MIVVLAGMAVLAVVGVLAVVAILALLLGGTVLAAGLAIKLAPVLLVAWIAVRLLRGRRYDCGHAVAARRERGYAHRPTVTEDDAWLDTRG